MSPTDPGAMGQNGTGQNVAGQVGMGPSGMGFNGGPTAPTPGSGLYQGNTYTPNGPGRYDPNSTNNMLSKPVTSNYGGYGTQTQAPRASYTPSAADTVNGIMNTANMSNIGVPPNPLAQQKPFNDYQRPSGYSPWMQLYSTPTNNGTVLDSTGTLSPVTVSDSRQPTHAGWSSSGSVSDFVGGTNTFTGNDLGWSPAVTTQDAAADVTPGGTVAAGNPGLKTPAVLASAGAGKGFGTTVLGGGLDLQIPFTTPAGSYAATLTLTLVSN